jgi:putative Mg2+ transporter-C (MgtC) family protein
MDLPFYEQFGRLLLAAVLGALVGLERERQSRPAGLRTHALVCFGSALAMLVSIYGFNDVLDTPGISGDPSRIAAQVVSGIGFIGAGTIIAQSRSIRGLTTAASLWTVAAIGLAAGGGMYAAAIAGTGLVLVVLLPLKYIEEHLIHTRPRPQPAIREQGRPRPAGRRVARFKRRDGSSFGSM